MPHVGGAALASFDLDGADADFPECWQYRQGIEAGGFLQRIECVVAYLEAPLAQGWIAGFFAGACVTFATGAEPAFGGSAGSFLISGTLAS